MDKPSPLIFYKSHSLHRAPNRDFTQLSSPGIHPPLQLFELQFSIIFELKVYLQYFKFSYNNPFLSDFI